MSDKIAPASDTSPPVTLAAKVKKQTGENRLPASPVSVQDNIEVKQQATESLQEQPQQMLKEKVTHLNKQMQSLRRDLRFTVDEKSGESVIKVIDAETKEVIRQIPSEEILKIRESIDNFKGLLFKSQV